MASIDFSQYVTTKELRELIKEIEGEIDRRKEKERERVLSQLELLAAEYGEKPQFFYRPQRGKTQSKTKTPKKRYQNPNNPEEIYEPGRGVKPPAWFKANSENIEAMEIRDN